MRKLLIGILLFTGSNVNAQTWAEWFQQKETQKKYLLQQIAALKVYIDYAEKGYTIANEGLQTIHSIKTGDFNLHNTFFNSLKQVNPAIKDWSRIADIVELQLKIVKQVKGITSAVKVDGELTNEELNYCQSVFSRLLDACLQNVEELVESITAGSLKMTDDARMKRIEGIWVDMQEKYGFVGSFGEEMKMLSVQRKNEATQIEFSKALNR